MGKLGVFVSAPWHWKIHSTLNKTKVFDLPRDSGPCDPTSCPWSWVLPAPILLLISFFYKYNWSLCVSFVVSFIFSGAVLLSHFYFCSVFCLCIMDPVFSICLLAETPYQLSFPPPKIFPSSWKAYRSAEAANFVPLRMMHGAGSVAVLGLWGTLGLICEINFRLSSCCGCWHFEREGKCWW